MRSILDTCNCTKGILLPRPPLSTREEARLDTLVCNACGLIYDAKDRGKSLANLRYPLYKSIDTIETKPERCPRCTSDKILTEEAPSRVPSHALRNPRNHPTFAYCGTCNSVLGRLPIDPELIKAYESKVQARRDHVDRIN